MGDIAAALQQAIYAALTSAEFKAAIAPLSFPVYDRVPSPVRPPYIKIGDDQVLADLASGYDGSRTHVTLTIWGPGPGKADVKRVAGAMRNALAPLQPGAAPFVIPGHQLVTWSFESARFLDDLDGVTAKGIVSITYETYPTA